MKRTDKTFSDLNEELRSLVDIMLFEDREKERMYEKINEIKHEIDKNN
ncbi:hypothetical protein [Staphylococcus arlettae]|nr:hypothetical protein [Staphylococcus arlettae]MDT3893189.1 hypothetical protein [Staphylococcus arlettae]